jgi:cytochrome d ubiquinol oxidase subunit I
MVGMGMLMLIVSWCAAWQQKRKKEISPGMLKILVAMTFSGWIATLAGWYVTEIGRQPYLVTGVLKTADAVTTLPSANIGTSLAIYLSLYAVLLVAYIRTLFVMARRAILVDRPEEDQTLQEKINVVKESTKPAAAAQGEQS